MIFPIIRGCQIILLLEFCTKVGEVAVSNGFADTLYGDIGAEKKLCGLRQTAFVQVGCGTDAKKTGEHGAEVARGGIYLIG